MEFKTNLEKILYDRGLRQDWVCRKTGIGMATLSRLVNGKFLPSIKVAYKIARLMELHVEDIWPWEEVMKEDENDIRGN